MNKFKKERRKKKLQDNLTTEITVRHITEVSVDPENPRFMLEENDQLNDGSHHEQQKSVISHLLSQLKIGMDLTKVTLPTFILEKRSLLEFFADLFAYPDLFVDIARKPTPLTRMIACVRFYLSTFSAGRESTTAKKPYNPIMGEYFRCFYNIDKKANTNNFNFDGIEEDLQKSNPLYWMSKDDLTFISEQVSHHPPVSACFAEHTNLGIRYEGHVWTKSKFYGLSVGVEMIGPGTIILINNGEEYELIYPNAVCRSILTVPWTELVGETTIRCIKTDLTARIKFHAKPFYRGQTHRISAEISEKGANQPVCTIDGRWDDRIFIQHTGGHKELLFDKLAMVRSPKRVRLPKDQDEMESRRMWFKVSEHLKLNNVEGATHFKSQLEQKQREDAINREKNDATYRPQFFTIDENKNWIYKFRDLYHKVPLPHKTYEERSSKTSRGGKS